MLVLLRHDVGKISLVVLTVEKSIMCSTCEVWRLFLVMLAMER